MVPETSDVPFLRLLRPVRHGRINPIVDESHFLSLDLNAAIPQISRSLDDLRRLGELDLKLNYPATSK